VNIRYVLGSRSARVGLLGALATGWSLAAIGAFADNLWVLGTGLVLAGSGSVVLGKALFEPHPAQQRTAARIVVVERQLARLRKSVRASRTGARQQRAQLSRMATRAQASNHRLEHVHHQVAQIDRHISALEMRALEAHQRVTEFERRVLTQVEPALGSITGRLHQQLARSMSDETVKELREIWMPRLRIELEGEAVRYLERRVLAVENLCVGRLAASVSDAVLRMLVARSVRSEHVQVLEIGVLYGVNAALLWDSFAGFPGRLNQTLVDRFNGYYGSEEADRFTGLPVTEHITRENLRRVGAPDEVARIVKGSSHDPDTVARVGDRDYDMVLIDGDHTYKGVSGDFARYSVMTRPGGYIVVDDYGSPGWPDVTRFVDDISHHPGFEQLGVFEHTAVLRRR
jgi:hypothetical protein